MFDVYGFYRDLNEKNVVLAYMGNVSDDLFHCMLDRAENKLDEIENSTKLKKKVFNILVEILQNIYHHADDFPKENEDYYSVVFLLSKIRNGYKIVTGNHIGIEKIAELERKIKTINAMSEEELKTTYRKRLDVGKVSLKGGAGLGMLAIIRKSGGKIEYEFKKVNDNFSFFSLQVKVIG